MVIRILWEKWRLNEEKLSDKTQGKAGARKPKFSKPASFQKAPKNLAVSGSPNEKQILFTQSFVKVSL